MNNAPRTNKFSGQCNCGTYVPAGAGSLGGKVDGRWVTRCAACTPAPSTSRSYSDDDGYDAMKDRGCEAGRWRTRY
jgi:hypothetical protein